MKNTRRLASRWFDVRLILAASMAVMAAISPALPQAAGGASQVPQPSGPTSGAAAWQALLGNTIAGATADGPYVDYFRPDGAVVHSDGDGREEGRWTLKDPAVCFVYPADADEHAECRTIEVNGTHGAFIDIDGSRYPFDIQPGNAKHF